MAKNYELARVNDLMRQVGAIDPLTADALDILNLFRELRWAVGAVEDGIMAKKFPKESN
jgi:hypothetical protein